MMVSRTEQQTQQQTQRTFKQLIRRARLARERKDDCQWEIGDAAAELDVCRGRPSTDRSENLKTFAGAIGEEHSTVRNYRAVSENLPPTNVLRRTFRDRLSWSYFAILYKREDAEELLQMCVDRGWTCEELREEIEARDREKGLREAYEASTAIITQEDALDFLAKMDDASADVLLTDPPYSTDLDDVIAFAAEWVPLALSRIKATGFAFICIGTYDAEILAYLNAFSGIGRFPEAQPLAWRYDNTIGPLNKTWLQRNWQLVWFLRGTDAPDLRTETITELFAAQTFAAPDGRHGKRYHQWQKPDDLADLYVGLAATPGQLVIDPFAGTGTFLLAAARAGCEAKGCDNDPKAVAIAKKRGCKIREVGCPTRS